MGSMLRLSKTMSAGLLVAGTAIGAGMLALPVATGSAGFLPSTVVFVLCYLLMTATGLLLFEVCRWMPKDSNIVSMASHLLGRGGKMFSWILYLFLFYSLTVSYVAGGGGFVTALFQNTIPSWLGIIVFVVLLSPIVYLGTKAVDRINLILMVGLGVSYAMFILLSASHVDLSMLTTKAWSKAWFALPIVFTSFSYQGIIPSLNTYLRQDPYKMRKAIFIGTTIPFILYLVWELLILGIVPAEGLESAKLAGKTAVFPLQELVGAKNLYAVSQAFAFFALTTSFLGVTLGLTDFLADGFKIVKKGNKNLLLCLVVFVPPTLIAIVNPNLFLSALNYAGGIGCALLLGLMPVMMVWVGRYQRKLKNEPQVFGGKAILVLLAAFIIFQLCITLINDVLS